MTSKAGLVLFLVLASCGSPPPQETTPAAPMEAPEADDQPTAGPSTPTPTPTPPAPGPAPTLAVTGTPASIGRTIAISITNRGTTEASLRSTLGIEVERDGAFVAVERSSLSLRYDCQHEADACVTLGPGAELLPPEWLGTWGDVQCVCTRCGPVDAGTYRFVATTCDGAHRIEGAPFTIR